MTPTDDANVQLLERDLRALAEPRDGDAALRTQVRGELESNMRPQPRRRLAIRPAFAWSLGTAAAAAAVAAVLIVLVGSAGTGGPATADAAIIHRALSSVTPRPNEILHVKLVAVQNGVPVAAELWQETSPPYAIRGRKGEVGHQSEFANNGRANFEYSPPGNVIHEQRHASRPTFSDPLGAVRRRLAEGQANVEGVVTIDGARLYKIDLPNGLVGYFGLKSYRPRYLDDPQRDGTVVRLRVAIYQYLPMTRTNIALLSLIAQHPGARVRAGGGASQQK